ncbi:MAG: serine/threonine protein kinase [Myxococcales bacterium]|nr:serine/threonine protein kinase [Myxococcales bacterium]
MLRALTTADDSARGLEDEPTPGGGAAAIAPPARIGRFEVRGVLGAGGMGVVYAAYDPELARRVAVKVLRERQAGREDRAWREARALARLAHPNVVAIFEVGRHDGRLFLAMELVEGEPCDVWLRGRARAPGEVLEVFFQAGRGLAAAHGAGIVHRDFKPSNVIVAVDGRARVVDFGLARGLGGRAEAAAADRDVAADVDITLTRAGGRPGTPRYMSPEQREGLAIDERSDQYAFCVALFEALAGDVPDATRSHPVFARRPLRRLHRALVRGLSADPAARYPTMAALCAALEAAMRPRRWPLAAAVAGLVGSAALGLLALRPPAVRCDGGDRRVAEVWSDARVARFAAAIAGGDADARATLTRAVETYLGEWSGVYTRVCEAAARGEHSSELRDLQMTCLDQRLRDLDAVLTLLEARPAGGGEVSTALSRVPPPESCAEAQALMRRAAPALEREHPDHPALLRRLAEAKALVLLARVDEAEAVALALAEEAGARGLATLVGEAHLLVGQGLVDIGQPRARERLTTALLHARAHGLEDLAVLASAALVRWSAIRALDPDDARLFAGLARAGLELTGDDGLLRAEVLQSLAKLHWLEGDVERMLPMLAEARELLARRLGERRPEVAAVLLDTAAALGRLQRADEALAQLLAARSIYEEHYGPLHPGLGRLYFNLSAAYADTGRLDEGLAANSRAVELLTASGVPPADIAAAKLNLVELLRRAGRAEEALPLTVEIDAVLVQAYGPDAPPVNMSRLAIAEVLHDVGRVAEAVAPYRDAWTLRRANLGEASPETVAARIKYAHALAVDDPAAALALLGDVEALPDDLQGLALLTRAQAGASLRGDPDAVAGDARRARARLSGGSEVEAVLRRELDALPDHARPR